jgi:hypothetical protein
MNCESLQIFSCIVDRGCEVTRVEGRGENLAVLRARFPSLATILFDLEDDPIPDLGGFDIVYAYGVLYHLAALSTAQRRVMTAIEQCRTAALGGHVEQCDACGHQRISYNSCRNRHCPKCQSLARAEWLEHRRSELLAVPWRSSSWRGAMVSRTRLPYWNRSATTYSHALGSPPPGSRP